MFGTKKLFAALMCLLLLCALCLPALAEEVEKVKYIEYKWDGKKLTSEEKTCTATKLTGDEETLSTGWYVAEGNVSFPYPYRPGVSGDVHLILADNCSLTASQGITVNEGIAADGKLNSLTIYAGREGTGALTVVPTIGAYAGIGGNNGESSGKIIIHGGKIEATSGTGGAAIGGGYRGSGMVEIYGGTVSATTTRDSSGAGIGGGGGEDKVTIYGGTVTVTTNGTGAGIGNGGSYDGIGSNSEVTIYGGTISITGGNRSFGGAGIGGGIGRSSKVTINGGTVTVESSDSVAMIGDGEGGRGGEVTIAGGRVSVQRIGGSDCEVSLGWKDEDDYIDAVEYAAKEDKVTLNSSFLVYGSEGPEEILAAGSYEAGSFAGLLLVPSSSSPRTVEYIEYSWDDEIKVLSSETKTRTNPRPLTGLDTVLTGGDTEDTAVWYRVSGPVTLSARPEVRGRVNLILMDGCSLRAEKGITVNEGNFLSIFAQSEVEGMGALTVAGQENDAGIGSTQRNGSGLITIHGGTVTAMSSGNGAGIGGGTYGTGKVTIYGGTVTATANSHAAGIGGGYGKDGNVTICGGTVTATVSGFGAAIGNGYNGSGGSIVIGDGMRVLAGANESEAAAVWKDDRVPACGNTWVQVRECLHDGEFRFNDREEMHCAYCGEKKNYPEFGAGTSANPWRISTAGLWNDVAAAVAGTLNTKEKHFLLAENISVTTMIGAKGKPFEGVFDGGGKTLIFNFENTDNDTSVAPFAWTSGATIRNLHVEGAITGSKGRAAGLIGENTDLSRVVNCRVSMSVSGSYYIAGFLVGEGTGGVHFTGCVFDGAIQSTDKAGGFAGWSEEDSHLSFNNCVFAPGSASVTERSGTFFFDEKNGGKQSLTNCYYLTPLGTAQGKQAYTVTAEPAVPLAFGEGETYPVSGITAFETGLSYKGVCLAAKDETVPVTIADMPDVTIDSLSASAGTLAREGGGWKLTMPDENVILTAGLRGTFRNPDFRIPASVTSIGAHAFEGAKMTAVEVGGKCGSIGEAAFKDCGSLVKIRIPASVKTIDDTAFDGCGTVFVFGASGSAAQAYCDARTNLVFVDEEKRRE